MYVGEVFVESIFGAFLLFEPVDYFVGLLFEYLEVFLSWVFLFWGPADIDGPRFLGFHDCIVEADGE